MIRKIIQIDDQKCNGCGACATACHEGAIGMVNGKAVLLRDDYCDGLGDCLPTCPTGAISFIEREAAAYDEKAVAAHMQKKVVSSGCPGHQMHRFNTNPAPVSDIQMVPAVSRLSQWPCQLKLVPINAPYFTGVDLLVAADCTAFAYARMHEDFMKDKITLIGCPKLDSIDYSIKLTEILRQNSIQSVTVVRMEVPCCGGLEMAVVRAQENSGKEIPVQVVTISMDGHILSTASK